MSEHDTTASTRDIADGDPIPEREKDGVAGDQDDDRLPARADDFVDVPPTVRLSAAADSMSEFNRILKEIAKSVWYVALILLGFFVVFVAYQVAKWGGTLV